VAHAEDTPTKPEMSPPTTHAGEGFPLPRHHASRVCVRRLELHTTSTGRRAWLCFVVLFCFLLCFLFCFCSLAGVQQHFSAPVIAAPQHAIWHVNSPTSCSVTLTWCCYGFLSVSSCFHCAVWGSGARLLLLHLMCGGATVQNASRMPARHTGATTSSVSQLPYHCVGTLWQYVLQTALPFVSVLMSSSLCLRRLPHVASVRVEPRNSHPSAVGTAVCQTTQAVRLPRHVC